MEKGKKNITSYNVQKLNSLIQTCLVHQRPSSNIIYTIYPN